MARIIIASKFYHPFRGGIEDVVRAIAEHLSATHEIKVLAFQHDRWGRSVREVCEGVSVIRTSAPLVVKSQPISFAYVRAMLTTPADLIFFHSPNVVGSVAVLLAKALRPRTRLVTFHHMEMYQRPKLRWIARHLYDRVLRRSDRLIVTSFKNAAHSQDIRVPVSTVAIPLGIDTARFEITPSIAAAGRALREAHCGATPLVAFVGRHARYKGLTVLVRAMADVPDAHLLIGGDGPYRREAEALVAKLGLTGRIHFLGGLSHEDKVGLLDQADVFAFPSTEITEAFGISQVEAMCVGAPVVAADLPTGVTDVAVHDETALLVPPGDSAALALAINRLIADRDLAARLARTARERVFERFTIDALVQRNARVLEEVLGYHPDDSAHHDLQVIAEPVEGERFPMTENRMGALVG